MLPKIIYRQISSEEDLQRAFEVRTLVFVHEQKFALEIEIDDNDRAQGTDHFLALDSSSNQPIATVRMFPSPQDPKTASLGRLACIPQYRGRGIGKRIMQLAHDQLRTRNFHLVAVHSQIDKEMFYQKLGYTRTSEQVFMEDGAPHIYMAMTL